MCAPHPMGMGALPPLVSAFYSDVAAAMQNIDAVFRFALPDISGADSLKYHCKYFP